MGSEHLKVVIGPEDYLKYPFLPEAIKIVKELGLTIEELGETPLGNEILEQAKRKILSVIEDGRYPVSSDDYRLEVSAFATAILLLSQVGDKALTEKFATAFSKSISPSLEADSRERVQLLFYISQVLGWNVKISNKIYVHFKNYIHAQPDFTGKWKLVNRALRDGYVEVSTHELARLIQTGVKKHVSRLVESASVDSSLLPERVYAVVEELSQSWAKTRREVLEFAQAGYRKSGMDAFPPCIKTLMDEAKSGKNLPHSARFVLASFLLNVGFTVDETLEIFKYSPDYREDLARYQVEHIAGLRGSRTKYTPYKCDNMRSLGLCRWRCEGVKHPLQYFYRALRGKTPRVVESQVS
ncbi:MAG: hypothetical protein ACPLRJ_03600 [Infirmifilum uzonense]|uniref:hypothetical protein n=1 Tax=Infirmifilum TaxID=2856573 RepID=UPI003C768E03